MVGATAAFAARATGGASAIVDFFASRTSVMVTGEDSVAGMFSLFSDVKSIFFTGESLTLRFSRFEAAYTWIVSRGTSIKRSMMLVARLTCLEGVI